MNSKTPSKILVIRNDKLGDFTLSLPTFALLKHCLPSTELHALVPVYTRPIAEACPYIDKIITDPGHTTTRQQQTELFNILKDQQYSAALTLYSTTRIGWLLTRLHIPLRFAPATKIAQVFYNHRIRQRRSLSLKPEFEYNLDLARQLLVTCDITCDYEPMPPYLHFPADEIAALKQAFCTHHNIPPAKQLIFIHAGSGGSANNLNAEQYCRIAGSLLQNDQYHVVLSAGPGEYELAQKMSTELGNYPHTIYESTEGLAQFARHIAFADLLISGSTGPLHVAGALNRPTVGFYTNRQSATSLRWQTLSAVDRRLAFSPPADAVPEDMSRVDLNSAVAEIKAMLVRLYPLTTGTNP